MDHLWATEITLKPAGPLTFRRIPSGSLPIMSYPFMPPTTMSGFLERLRIIAEGGDWPGYGEDWYGKGADDGGGKRKKAEESPTPGKWFTLTLDKAYRTLGAFPDPSRWSMHTTRRHGPKNFQHSEFSQLLRHAHNENYQLHYWDYLFCEELKGWVVAADRAPIERLSCLKGYGGKAGKEGFIFVTAVTPPRELDLKEGEYRPAGLVPVPLRPATGTFYTLYGHHWDDAYLWSNGDRGGVAGYFQQGAWWNVQHMQGAYWAMETGYGIPATAPDAFLKGDVEPFYGGTR